MYPLVFLPFGLSTQLLVVPRARENISVFSAFPTTLLLAPISSLRLCRLHPDAYPLPPPFATLVLLRAPFASLVALCDSRPLLRKRPPPYGRDRRKELDFGDATWNALNLRVYNRSPCESIRTLIVIRPFLAFPVATLCRGEWAVRSKSSHHHHVRQTIHRSLATNQYKRLRSAGFPSYHHRHLDHHYFAHLRAVTIPRIGHWLTFGRTIGTILERIQVGGSRRWWCRQIMLDNPVDSVSLC